MNVDIKNFTKEPWTKIWAGDWSVHTCSYWGDHYVHTLIVNGRVFLERVVIVVQEGKSWAYATERNRREFGTFLAEEVLHHPERVRVICEDLKHRVDDILSFIRQYEGKDIDVKTYQEYWSIHRAYYIPHVNVKYVVDYLEPELLLEYLPAFEDARTYCEPVFKKTEQFSVALAKIVGKKYGLPSHLVLCAVKGEFEQYFIGGRLPEERVLEERWKKSALYYDSDIHDLVTGKEAEALEHRVAKKQNTHVLQGSTAYPGKTQGMVKIVFDPHKVHRFSDGDILVTGMTRPEFLPIMKKASAFVTDSGGILCHAAIVAREMKKPCIIGTEVATKVLKDGDMVEVDAERGIVRKIE